MSVSAAIRRMLDAGLTIDHALLAAEVCEQEIEPKKTARQLRNKRYYDSKKRLNQDVSDVSDVSDDLPPEGFSPTPPFPKPLSPPSPPKGGSSPTNFALFWDVFPNRVGKREAEKAFAKAATRAQFLTIMAGLHRYVEKTDDRPWCNPATWLNQDRWTDEPAAAVARSSTGPPPKPTPTDALKEFAELKGWTDGPNGSNGHNHDVELFPADGSGRPGEIVSLRGGVAGRYR